MRQTSYVAFTVFLFWKFDFRYRHWLLVYSMKLALIRELTQHTVVFRDVNFAMILVNVTQWAGRDGAEQSMNESKENEVISDGLP